MRPRFELQSSKHFKILFCACKADFLNLLPDSFLTEYSKHTCCYIRTYIHTIKQEHWQYAHFSLLPLFLSGISGPSLCDVCSAVCVQCITPGDGFEKDSQQTYRCYICTSTNVRVHLVSSYRIVVLYRIHMHKACDTYSMPLGSSVFAPTTILNRSSMLEETR